MTKVLEENQKLVIVFNHASPLSWLPAIALLAAHVTARGGGSRKPVGVMDRLFFEVPFVKQLAGLLTQFENPPSFLDLTSSFVDGDATDLVVFPEGSNCFFGDPAELKPFRSAKFVELAIRANAPIYVCVHKGSEAWGKVLPVPPNWLEMLHVLPPIVQTFLKSRVESTGQFTLPMWPTAMERFEMWGTLYHPTLKASDLSEDKEEKLRQLTNEADAIREIMLKRS
ncbi:MAG: 1-acyl-sn-glycerol-3-phosphate acyltransferase [Bdellovibrionota bacterium]